MHFTALPFDQLDHSVDQPAGAAHREMNAPMLFEKSDETINRSGAERAPADQQRMEAEDRPQPLVADIGGDQPVDAAVSVEPEQVGQDAEHVHRRAEMGV